MALFFLIIFITFNPVKGETTEKVELIYKFKYPKISKKSVSGKIVDVIDIEGLEKIYEEVGYPKLPFKTVKILLPPDAEVLDVEVNGKPLSLGKGYILEPGQEYLPLSKFDKNRKKLIFNEAIYKSLDPYPPKLFSEPKIQYYKGYKILLFNIYPVQYLPKTGEILFYDKLKVKVNYRRKHVYSKAIRFLRNDYEDIKEIKNFVDNPDFVRFYFDVFPFHRKLQTGGYEYVIITTKYLNSSNLPYNLSTLVEWKRSRGINATIVTVEDILSNPTFDCNGPWGDGCAEPQFNDTAAHIRNFIKFAYSTWGTKYVLLVGDADGTTIANSETNNSANVTIPARCLWAWDYECSPPCIASDLYYACLDGSFDENLNGTFGEPNDGENGTDVDLLCEVYVGRVPADSWQEIANFVKKLIWYENSTITGTNLDFFVNALSVGEYLGFGGVADWGGNYKDEIVYGSDAHGYSTRGMKGFYNVTTLYDRDYYEEFGTGWPASKIIEMLNSSNYHVINHLGHSNVGYNMKMTNLNVSALNNSRYFIGYSQGCYAGSFDNRDASFPYGTCDYLAYDSIAEHFVTSPAGAVAYIANSRYGFGIGDSTDGPSQRYDRQFWDAILNESLINIGKANQDSKHDNIGYIIGEDPYDESSGVMRFCYYEITLFGDPEMPVFAEKQYDVGIVNATINGIEVKDKIIVFEPKVEIFFRIKNYGLPTIVNVSLYCNDGTLLAKKSEISLNELEEKTLSFDVLYEQIESCKNITLEVSTDNDIDIKDNKLTVDIVVNPAILIVDDDGADNYEIFYEEALKSLNAKYVTVTSDYLKANEDILDKFSVVIWETGNDYTVVLDEMERELLANYLDKGGKLFISGQDIGYSIKDTEFYRNYLHATYIKDDAGNYTLEGVAGDPISDGLVIGIKGGDGANNQEYPDEIAPADGNATCIFNYTGDGCGAIRVNTGTYKVVYFAFGFEGINTTQDRITVMRRVLDWLNVRPSLEFKVTPPYGLNTTIFNFTCIYTDINNNTPAFINLTLNGQEYQMIPANASDTDVTDGKLYYINMTLPSGVYYFNVTASDGENYAETFSKVLAVADDVWSNLTACTVNSTRTIENATVVIDCDLKVNSTLSLNNVNFYIFYNASLNRPYTLIVNKTGTFKLINTTVSVIYPPSLFYDIPPGFLPLGIAVKMEDKGNVIVNTTTLGEGLFISLENSNITAVNSNISMLQINIENTSASLHGNLTDLILTGQNFLVNLTSTNVDLDLQFGNVTLNINNTYNLSFRAAVSRVLIENSSINKLIITDTNITFKNSKVEELDTAGNNIINGYVNITSFSIFGNLIRYVPLTIFNLTGGNPISNVSIALIETFRVQQLLEEGLGEEIENATWVYLNLSALNTTDSSGFSVIGSRFNKTTLSYRLAINATGSIMKIQGNEYTWILPRDIEITPTSSTATPRGMIVKVDLTNPNAIPLNPPNNTVINSLDELRQTNFVCNLTDDYNLEWAELVLLTNTSLPLNATNYGTLWNYCWENNYVGVIKNATSDFVTGEWCFGDLVTLINNQYRDTNNITNVTIYWTCIAVDSFFNSNLDNYQANKIILKAKKHIINITSNTTFEIIFNNYDIITLNATKDSAQEVILPNGTYDIKLHAFDNALNVSFYDVENWRIQNITILLDKPNVSEYLVTYAIKPNFDANATLVISYKDTGFTNEDYLGLYKCDDWDFAQNKCNSGWYKVTSNYTIDKSKDLFIVNTSSFSAFAIKQEPYCGDGVINPEIGEECDGSDFGGKTCKDFGYDAGYLVCTSTCKIDTSHCYNKESEGGGGVPSPPPSPLKIFNYPNEVSVEQNSSVTFNITVANLGSAKLNNVKLTFSETLPKDWVSIKGNNVAINPNSLHTFIVTITVPRNSLTGKFEIYFNVTCKEGYKDEAKLYLEIKPYPKEKEIAEKKLEEVRELLKEVLNLLEQLKNKKVDVKDIENVISSANNTINDAEKYVSEKDYDKAMQLLDEAEAMLLDAKALAKNLLIVKIEGNMTQQKQEELKESENKTERKESQKQKSQTQREVKVSKIESSKKSTFLVVIVVAILAILFIFYKLYFPQEVPERYITER